MLSELFVFNSGIVPDRECDLDLNVSPDWETDYFFGLSKTLHTIYPFGFSQPWVSTFHVRDEFTKPLLHCKFDPKLPTHPQTIRCFLTLLRTPFPSSPLLRHSYTFTDRYTSLKHTSPCFRSCSRSTPSDLHSPSIVQSNTC